MGREQRMFIDYLNARTQEKYKLYVKWIGMLSKLFSENDTPYINSRVAENIFCEVTGAENLGRADCSVDAKLGSLGIGIKTFLANNDRTMQKVAEFNKDASLFKYKRAEKIISIVANLRNERIESTKRIYGLNKLIYHCIVRQPGIIKICESTMDLIDVENITDITHKNNGNVICFQDGKNEYSFNLSKNTLYKRFDTSVSLLTQRIEILSEPYKALERIFASEYMVMDTGLDKRTMVAKPSVILPLFSDKGGRHVPEKSGLNQWNAEGRPRDANEIYIPIPAWIHKTFPDFFPERNQVFTLVLPMGRTLMAKVCQQGNKALMSNPNLALGEWLLRDVMNLEEGKILTYEKLQILGIDSVEIVKMEDETYKIDFRTIGTYDEFFEENNN